MCQYVCALIFPCLPWKENGNEVADEEISLSENSASMPSESNPPYEGLRKFVSHKATLCVEALGLVTGGISLAGSAATSLVPLNISFINPVTVGLNTLPMWGATGLALASGIGLIVGLGIRNLDWNEQPSMAEFNHDEDSSLWSPNASGVEIHYHFSSHDSGSFQEDNLATPYKPPKKKGGAS